MATFGVFNVNCQLTLKSKESSKRRRLDRDDELEHWKALAMQQQASIALLLSQRATKPPTPPPLYRLAHHCLAHPRLAHPRLARHPRHHCLAHDCPTTAKLPGVMPPAAVPSSSSGAPPETHVSVPAFAGAQQMPDPVMPLAVCHLV